MCSCWPVLGGLAQVHPVRSTDLAGGGNPSPGNLRPRPARLDRETSAECDSRAANFEAIRAEFGTSRRRAPSDRGDIIAHRRRRGLNLGRNVDPRSGGGCARHILCRSGV